MSESLLDRILRIAGLSGIRRRLPRLRFPSSERNAAVAAYEGLMTDYRTVVEIPVKNASGTGTTLKRVSIASIGVIDGQAANQSRTDAKNLLDTLVEEGLIAYARPNYTPTDIHPRGHGQPRDPRLFDGTTIDWPMTRAHNLSTIGGSSDPRKVPSQWPLIRHYRRLYPTPRFFNRALTPNDRLYSVMERAVTGLHRYLQSRNCNMVFHPVVIGARQPPIAVNTADVLGQYRANTQGWLPPSFETDPATAVPLITGPSNGDWRQSLQQGSLWKARYINDTSWTFYDAQLDIVQALQALSAVLDGSTDSVHPQGVLIDVQVCSTAYNLMLRQAYRQIGKPYGGDIASFEATLAREAEARRNRGRSAGVAATGSPGYQSRGDDAEDLSSALVNTLTLALAAGAATGVAGALVAVFVVGLIALFSFMSGEEAPRNPLKNALFLTDGGASLHGITPEHLFKSWPMVKVRP